MRSAEIYNHVMSLARPAVKREKPTLTLRKGSEGESTPTLVPVTDTQQSGGSNWDAFIQVINGTQQNNGGNGWDELVREAKERSSSTQPVSDFDKLVQEAKGTSTSTTGKPALSIIGATQSTVPTAAPASQLKEDPFQLRMAKQAAQQKEIANRVQDMIGGLAESAGGSVQQKRQTQAEADADYRKSLWKMLGLAADNAQMAQSGTWESVQDSEDRAQKMADAGNELHRAKQASDEAAAAFEDQGFFERQGHELSGWGQRTLGNLGNTLLTVGDAYNQADAQMQAFDPNNLLISQMHGLDPVAEAEKQVEARTSGEAREMLDKAYGAVDRLADAGNEELQKAKDGASALGRLGLDLETGALDLGADAAANFVAPGAGTAMMATRVFGEAARDERQKGGDLGKQMLAGTKAAAIEVLTEKISGPFEKIYGKSFTGKAINKALDAIDSKGGRMAINLLTDALGEGAEEILSDILNPVADRALGLADSWDEAWSETTLEGVLYDGLVGALLGMAGSVGKIMQTKGKVTAEDVQQIKAEGQAAAERAMQQTAPAGEITAQEAAKAQEGEGDISVPPDTQNADTGESERLNPAETKGEAEAVAEQEKTAPNGAEESTEVNTDPTEHTQAEQAMDKKGGVTQAPDAKNPGNTPNASLASSPQAEDTSSTPNVASDSAIVNGEGDESDANQPPVSPTLEKIYDLFPSLRPTATEGKASNSDISRTMEKVTELITGAKGKTDAKTADLLKNIISAATHPGRAEYYGDELLSKLEKSADALGKSPAANTSGIADSFKAWVDGRKTADELKSDYNALTNRKGGYYYDQSIADRLNTIAEAERNGEHLDSSGRIRPEYRQMIERMATQLEHRTRRQAEKMEQRNELSKEIRTATPAIKRGVKGTISKAANWYSRVQSRPDTLFYSLAGFDRRNGKALYELGEKSRKVVADKINVHQTAESFFESPASMDGYKDFARGKSTMPNIIPGLDTNGKGISLNYALGLLKLLETDGAIDHIIENGAQFAYSEKELYSGRNNNGFGDVKGYAQDIPLISEQASDALRRAQTEEQKATAKEAAAKELEQLAGQLRQYVTADPVAKAVYDASFQTVDYLRGKINETSHAMYGTDFANQDRTYWPMEIANRQGGSELLNDQRAGLKEASIVQKRTGPGGALRVRPFTDVMSRYIDQASDWAAFAEFSDELELLSKDAGEQAEPLTAQIGDTFGKGYKKWLETYVSELNGQGRDTTSSVLGKLRSNIAQSSLLLNGGVALKQTPSYFDFGGEIDLDILAKHIPGMFKTAKSFDNNALIKEIDQRSGILGSRRMGYNNVEMGEATNAARSLGTSFADRLPSWLTNWINKSDYRTVSNGLLACADQVRRDHPEVKDNSLEFYDLVTEKFETAVMRSQPIYNRHYRAEYLRSQNEWVRMFSMFRTQQTQNFNQLLTAAGEYQAAQRTGSKADVQQAKNKLQGVVGGQISGAVVYSILTAAARALIHKDDDFEDENGDWQIGKIAVRLGLNFIGSIASTSWFGDALSAVAIDTITNAATGGKGTSEFYDFEESVSGMIADMGSGIISFAKKPSLKTGKNLVFSVAQALGIPARNVYNMVNTVTMFSLDATGKNPGGYDDVISMIQSYQSMTDKQRAAETAKAAMNYYHHGKEEQAEALLSTLDVEAPGVADAIKKAASDRYISGQIPEEQYRTILRTYCGIDSEAAEKQIEKDRTTGEYNAVMESGRADDAEKYDSLDRSLKDKRNEAFTGFYDSSQDRAITADIIRAALPDSDTDTMVKKYTSAGYQSDYATLRAAGYNPGEAIELHNSIDSDENGSIKQAEMWEYFQTNPANESVVSALWDSKGYKKTWEEYKQGKSK